MSDSIRLRNIRAWGRHGVPVEERQKAQPFDIDVQMQVEVMAARVSDELSDTVDYSRIHAEVVRIVETRSFCLMERLGQEILNFLFTDSRIIAATVTIAKPQLLAGATPEVTVCADRLSLFSGVEALSGLTLKP